MMKELIPIDHAGLPDKLSAGLMELPLERSFVDRGSYRMEERQSGRRLIEQLVSTAFGPGDVHIKGGENEKPTGLFNGLPLHLSISHTRSAISGVVSLTFNLGMDLERCDRVVPKALADRITHPGEAQLIQKLPLIQLWTVKEAALKWCGTGLRTSMKKVTIESRSGDCLQVLINGTEKASVCSFRLDPYWISIAFDR